MANTPRDPCGGDAAGVPSLRDTSRALALVAPALLLYTVALPLLGLHMDRRHGVALMMPPWALAIAAALIASGVLIATWSAVLLVTPGGGSPNPVRPPSRLVTTGPYARSRNPLMVGGWIFGAGLGLALGSPGLLAIYTAVALLGMIYVRTVEEPKLIERFGSVYRSYCDRVPRWLLVIGLLLAAPAGVLEAQQRRALPDQTAVLPVVVRIDLVPGGNERWMSLFEPHMAPAIRDAIARGDEIVDLEYFEGLVFSEDTDVVLIMKLSNRRIHHELGVDLLYPGH